MSWLFFWSKVHSVCSSLKSTFQKVADYSFDKATAANIAELNRKQRRDF